MLRLPPSTISLTTDDISLAIDHLRSPRKRGSPTLTEHALWTLKELGGYGVRGSPKIDFDHLDHPLALEDRGSDNIIVPQHFGGNIAADELDGAVADSSGAASRGSGSRSGGMGGSGSRSVVEGDGYEGGGGSNVASVGSGEAQVVDLFQGSSVSSGTDLSSGIAPRRTDTPFRPDIAFDISLLMRRDMLDVSDVNIGGLTLSGNYRSGAPSPPSDDDVVVDPDESLPALSTRDIREILERIRNSSNSRTSMDVMNSGGSANANSVPRTNLRPSTRLPESEDDHTLPSPIQQRGRSTERISGTSSHRSTTTHRSARRHLHHTPPFHDAYHPRSALLSSELPIDSDLLLPSSSSPHHRHRHQRFQHAFEIHEDSLQYDASHTSTLSPSPVALRYSDLFSLPSQIPTRSPREAVRRIYSEAEDREMLEQRFREAVEREKEKRRRRVERGEEEEYPWEMARTPPMV